ncbi:phosphatidylserine synthase [Flavobacterium sp. NST-5]|uniref:Phosphatidylserine synthase n=1 Tax=Flavobacterium ichthyis TaxID=2698827 RepID=A0ABW9ZDL0_9FLAO|nr:CDP-alcohol phosphatidyltransferase family protein [Flavobacterium ichthyis]NBL64858.1 phosphatidylserine synthase [Flavobacterium ichthyis]
MKIKAHIPNFITLLNLLSGCFALIFVTHNDFLLAFSFVALGIFLDFFDGFFARILKVPSALGLQLDSLADMVTSGVVPGFVMYKMMHQSLGFPAYEWSDFALPFAGFLITLGSCYRLAKFNIDTRQTDSFIGLPTPGNALFIMSLPIIAMQNKFPFISEMFENFYFLLGIAVLSAYMMNAEIPLFSLKIKEFTWKKMQLPVFFLLASLVMLIFLKMLAVPLIIIFYICLSVGLNFSKTKVKASDF